MKKKANLEVWMKFRLSKRSRILLDIMCEREGVNQSEFMRRLIIDQAKRTGLPTQKTIVDYTLGDPAEWENVDV